MATNIFQECFLYYIHVYNRVGRFATATVGGEVKILVLTLRLETDIPIASHSETAFNFNNVWTPLEISGQPFVDNPWVKFDQTKHFYLHRFFFYKFMLNIIQP